VNNFAKVCFFVTARVFNFVVGVVGMIYIVMHVSKENSELMM